MHECARDPALPMGPIGRPVYMSVQRWDPTLPCALGVSSWVHTCAAEGAHAVRHSREHEASMERVARQIVSHLAQSPDTTPCGKRTASGFTPEQARDLLFPVASRFAFPAW
jgi:hypothetical protein